MFNNKQDSNIMTKEAKEEYFCEICSYSTKRKSDYRRHISSSKHVEKAGISQPIKKRLTCECGKIYSHMSGLSRHRSSCLVYNEVSHSHTTDNNNSKSTTTKLLGDILQQMRDLRQMVPTTTTSNVTNTNNNYIVNLNVFLNEKCKDALSLEDFMKQIEFVFDDLSDSKWRSKILLDNLGSLQVEDRPFHCLDPTTCQVVLKNGTQWKQGGKDDIELTLDNCSKQVQQQFGNKWEHSFPGWTSSDTQNKKYMSLWRNITSEPSKQQMAEEIQKISSESIIPSGNLTN